MAYFEFDPARGYPITEEPQEDPYAELKKAYGEEWFFDASPAKAAARVGIPLNDLADVENDKEVQLERKRRLLDEPPMPSKDQIVMRLFEEGNFYGGSQAARVSALMNAAKLMGFVEEKVNVKGKMEHKVSGGVMVVNTTVDATDLDAWEKNAIDLQAQLPT